MSERITVDVEVAPARDIDLGGRGGYPAEIEYRRIVPEQPGGEPRDPIEVQETSTVTLDQKLRATKQLTDIASETPIELRVLSANGRVRVRRTATTPRDDGKIRFELTDEEMKIIVASEPRPDPAPRPVERLARFIPIGSEVVPFGSCRLQVAPVRVADGGWETLGLRNLFNLASPAMTSVALHDTSRVPTSVLWMPISLGADGSFRLTLEEGGGDGWLWWLDGTRSAAGSVLDDFQPRPPRLIGIPLPPFPAAPTGTVPGEGTSHEGEGRVPVAASEGEAAENPQIYTEDPGAFCRPFSNPERILGEKSFSVVLRAEQPAISSEPVIRVKDLPVFEFDPPILSTMMRRSGPGLAEATASGLGVFTPGLPTKFVDLVQHTPRGRVVMDANHPIQWEADASQYQATTVARGHILEYRLRWRSNGYSLGTVAKTLTLAPRQVKRVQTIEWQRSERTTRREVTQLVDRVEDEVTRERTYDDEVQASLSEWARGQSESSASSAAGGFGFASVGLVIGGGGAHSNASSESSTEGGRRTVASEEQRLRDSIRRFADSLRRLESMVVQEVTQEETVTGTTEVIRNPNYGHSLTVLYYQILRHLKIETAFAGVRECLFVPFAIRPFTVSRALRWRESIAKGLRDTRHREALRYLKDVATGFADSSIPPGRYADQPIRHVHGSIYLRMSIERPKDKNGDFDDVAWFTLNPLLSYPPRGIFAKLKAMAEAQRDASFQKDYAPGAAARWANFLKFHASGQQLNADFTMATRYKFGGTVRVDFTAPVDGNLTRQMLSSILVSADKSLPAGSVANLERMEFTYQTDTFRRTVSITQGSHDLVDVENGEADPSGVALTSVPDQWEQRDVRAEITRAVSDLVTHLNEHMEYYQKVILSHMDRDRLFMLVDGFYVPGTNGVSIASVIEREPIGFAGNCLVFRVSSGSFLGIDDIDTPQKLYGYYAARQNPREAMYVSLPTDGLYAQTIMDECEALEEHFGNTNWVLSDKEPELGEIAPELLLTRRAEPQPTTPSPFPQTIVNLQNAPEAPPPSGLAGVLSAVTTPNAFRDMAGLAGTQANVQAAMQTAASLAQNFGNQAAALKLADIAAKAQAAQTTDQKLASIEKAKQMNLINAQEASSQARAVLGDLHGTSSAGTTPHQDAVISDAIRTSGPGSIIEATTPGGQVKVQKGGGTGTGAETPGTGTPSPTTEEEPAEELRLDGVWGDSLGAEMARADTLSSEEFLREVTAFDGFEHDFLARYAQGMIDVWAQKGLIMGGAMVAEGTTHPGFPKDYTVFLPDAARPNEPYHNIPPLSRAHWRYVFPDPIFSNPASNTRWTEQSLKQALIAGDAVALTVGEIILLAGDLVGTATDFFAPAGRDRWKLTPSASMLFALRKGEPIAHTIFDITAFPPAKGVRSDVSTINKLKRSRQQYSQVAADVTAGKFRRTFALIKFFDKIRGTTPWAQLHVLSQLRRRGDRFTVEDLLFFAPWLSLADANTLKDELGAEDYGKVSAGVGGGSDPSKGFESDAFKILVSNGWYLSLAMHNESHFAPGNWTVFEDNHRTALELVRAHVFTADGSAQWAPIPAQAIAMTAYSLHYLTDAYSAGHMRVPRALLGTRGALAAKVMHDLDGTVGLNVTNGFGDKWRAWGDGYLPGPTRADQKAIQAQINVAGSGIDATNHANLERATIAVGSAFKQLHYEAQRHFNDPGAAAAQPTLQRGRRSTSELEGDRATQVSLPGTGTFTDWLTMEIDAKVAYMRKHQPIPIPDGAGFTDNHPPLIDAAGNIAPLGYQTRQVAHKFGLDRELDMIWPQNKTVFTMNVAKYQHLSTVIENADQLLPAGGALGVQWIEGGEAWFQALIAQLPEAPKPSPDIPPRDPRP
jgi:hypothetical protein